MCKMKESEKAVEYIQKTKADAMRMLDDARHEVECWENVVRECDNDFADASFDRRASGKCRIAIIVITVLVLISIVVCGSGCGTIEGLRQDVHQWTEPPAHHRTTK